MRTDYTNWQPLSVAEISAIFTENPVVWAIAGGWAVDLYLGRQTREHSDIDVILLHDQQAVIYQHLSKDWQLHKARNGKLTPWEPGDTLTDTKDIWVCKDSRSPWAFQLMLVRTEQHNWIYSRQKSIIRPLDEIFSAAADGIPYLLPEIQLLYKGGGAEIRDKDLADLANVLPALSAQAKKWLGDSLQQQFPAGHPWIDIIMNK